MPYVYDDQNIFARILRGEIPNRTVLETDHTLAFADINPQAPLHVLVIPKGRYVNFDDFGRNASDAEVADFYRVAAEICRQLGISPADGGGGYRTISNAGSDGRQEVAHFHMHILAGRNVGPMLAPAGQGAAP